MISASKQIKIEKTLNALKIVIIYQYHQNELFKVLAATCTLPFFLFSYEKRLFVVVSQPRVGKNLYYQSTSLVVRLELLVQLARDAGILDLSIDYVSTTDHTMYGKESDVRMNRTTKLTLLVLLLIEYPTVYSNHALSTVPPTTPYYDPRF